MEYAHQHNVDILHIIHIAQPLVEAANHVGVWLHTCPWWHGTGGSVRAVHRDRVVAPLSKQLYVLRMQKAKELDYCMSLSTYQLHSCLPLATWLKVPWVV